MNTKTNKDINVKAPKSIAKRVYNAAGNHLDPSLKRHKQVCVSMNEIEYKTLQLAHKEALIGKHANLSMGEFTRSVVNSYASEAVFENGITELNRIIAEMQRVGSQINHIALSINTDSYDQNELNSITNHLKEFYRLVKGLPIKSLNNAIDQIVKHESLICKIGLQKSNSVRVSNEINVRFNSEELKKITDVWEANKKQSGLKCSLPKFVKCILLGQTPIDCHRSIMITFLSIAFQISAVANNLSQIHSKLFNQKTDNKAHTIDLSLINRCANDLFDFAGRIRERCTS